MNRPRYRARVEICGVELFDRISGRAIALDELSAELVRDLDRRFYASRTGSTESLAQEGETAAQRWLLHGMDGSPIEIGLDAEGTYDVEPLIETPYPKSEHFASAPRRLYWELTRACNLNCASCYNRPHGRYPEQRWRQLRSWAKEFYASGVYEVRCTGGEPTAREGFFDFVDELHEIGFYLSMGTNGVYEPEILRQVLSAPFDWIIVSVDGGTRSTHEAVRGAHTYDRALSTLRILCEEKECRIRVNTLIRRSSYRYSDLSPLVALCDKLGVESLNCIPLRPQSNRRSMRDEQLTPLEFREFIHGLHRFRSECRTDIVTTLDLRHTASHDRVFVKDRSCAAGREGAVVSPHGEVYGCSYSPASDPDLPAERRAPYVAGHLPETPFPVLWNDSSRWKIFRDLKTYKHRRCHSCAYYAERRCIGSCPIMNRDDPGGFDPYCYLHLQGDQDAAEHMA